MFFKIRPIFYYFAYAKLWLGAAAKDVNFKYSVFCEGQYNWTKSPIILEITKWHQNYVKISSYFWSLLRTYEHYLGSNAEAEIQIFNGYIYLLFRPVIRSFPDFLLINSHSTQAYMHRNVSCRNTVVSRCSRALLW